MDNTDSEINLFADELDRLNMQDSQVITLDKLSKIKMLDENNEARVNLLHIHKDKKGYFNKQDFIYLSDFLLEKEKLFKRHELNRKLLAVFNLLMIKEVCSYKGEKLFVNWFIKMFQIIEFLNNNNNNNNNENTSNVKLSFIKENQDKIEEIKRFSNGIVKLFYNLTKFKKNNNMSFSSFYDLIQIISIELDDNSKSYDDLIRVEVLDLFSTQYIRGLSKLIVDIEYEELIYGEDN